MEKREVTVWNKQYEVSVYKTSKTVWRAVGQYEGERIETKGRTDTAALAAWRKAASYRGNL